MMLMDGEAPHVARCRRLLIPRAIVCLSTAAMSRQDAETRCPYAPQPCLRHFLSPMPSTAIRLPTFPAHRDEFFSGI